MTSEEWPRSYTRIQGKLIALHREQQSLTHTQLVERVNRLGVDIQRTTLVNIEQGRRKSLSVPEVFAFAYALNVPPLLLLAPVGNVETVEVLSGIDAHPWKLANWIQGRALLEEPISGIIPADHPLREQAEIQGQHMEVLQRHAFLDRLQLDVIYAHNEPLTREQKLHLLEDVEMIQSWRNTIRESGLIPPPLWPEFAELYPQVK